MKGLKYLVLALIYASLVSCDILENQTPQQSLPVDEIVNSPDGIQDLITGMYDGLQNGNIAGGNFNISPEIMSDNTTWSGSFVNYQRQAARTMLPSDAQIQNWWNISYREINTANLILKNAPTLDDPTFSEEDRDLALGEGHYVRGILYFEMARVYSKPWGSTSDNSHDAVPLRLTPVEGVPDFENLSRSSLNEVYAQVEQDLIAAASLLPDTGVRSNRRATRYSALGYLMRLELERQNYNAAADYADEIISSGVFSLTSDPAGPFENEFSSESIFEIVHTAQDNPGVNLGQNAFYTSTSRNGRGDIQYSDDFFEALQSTVTQPQQEAISAADLSVVDLRSELIDTESTSTIKFPDGATNADNVINMRYPDILLARAEALTELAGGINDVPQEVYDLLNDVRSRSIKVTDASGAEFSELIEFGPGDFASKEELMDAILLDRRVELAFEGDRFHTLKRRGLPIRGLPHDDNSIVFPIPQGEMDANINMDQNEGY